MITQSQNVDPIKILQKGFYYIFYSNFEAIHFIHKSLVLLREIDQNIAFDCKGDEGVLQTLIFEHEIYEWPLIQDDWF